MKFPVHDRIDLKHGLILTFKTLKWDDGWEFECPSMCLSPIIHFYEDGSSHHKIIEDVCLEAICCGHFKSDDFQKACGWRGYNLPVLRRRFREALGGKKFPVAGYQAKEETIIFKAVITECGIEWDWSPLPAAGQVFRRKTAGSVN
jgi:hypothetical protein